MNCVLDVNANTYWIFEKSYCEAFKQISIKLFRLYFLLFEYTKAFRRSLKAMRRKHCTVSADSIIKFKSFNIIKCWLCLQKSGATNANEPYPFEEQFENKYIVKMKINSFAGFTKQTIYRTVHIIALKFFLKMIIIVV